MREQAKASIRPEPGYRGFARQSSTVAAMVAREVSIRVPESPSARWIGSWNLIRTLVPKGTGNILLLSSFQEPSMAVGTTGSFEAASSRTAVPAFLNSCRLPSLDRVPSGKMTADTSRSWQVAPNSAMARTAPTRLEARPGNRSRSRRPDQFNRNPIFIVTWYCTIRPF